MLGLNLSLMMQRASSSGPVTITITSADAADGAIIVATSSFSGGALLLDIDAPAAYAGEYVVSLADLEAGPVNLVAPSFTGTTGEGDTITITPGLWVSTGALTVVSEIVDAGGGVLQSGFGPYTLTASDMTGGVNLRETATDERGSRLATHPVKAFVFQPVTLSTGRPPTPNSDPTQFISKLTLAMRIRVSGLANFEQLLSDFGSISLYIASNNLHLDLRSGAVVQSFTNVTTTLLTDNFVSLLLAIDYLNAGDLGAGVVGKLRAVGGGVDETITLNAPVGWSETTQNLGTSWFWQGDTTQFKHWAYLDTAAARDPATAMGDFFDLSAGGEVRHIGVPAPDGVGFPGGVTPSFFLQAPASNFANLANAGANAAFRWDGNIAVTEV